MTTDQPQSHKEIRAQAIAQGMQLYILCRPDACPVCAQFRDKIYWADQAVELPVGGCLKQECQCEYRIIDPSGPTLEEMLQAGVEAAKAKDIEQAQEWLFAVLRINPYSEAAWLWLSGVVESDEDRLECMERVLEINPDNELAQRGLQTLHAQGVGVEPPAPAEPGVEEPPAA